MNPIYLCYISYIKLFHISESVKQLLLHFNVLFYLMILILPISISRNRLCSFWFGNNLTLGWSYENKIK
jgi:hypothetical protein